jgi:hypothetical protein
MWHIDPLIGNDRETRQRAVTTKRSANKNEGMVFSALSAKQQLDRNRGPVFSLRSVPRYYNQEMFRMVMNPAGLGPEDDCAGDAQQQLQTADPPSR